MTVDKEKLRALAEACPHDDTLRLVDYSGTWYLRNTAGTVLEVRRNSSFPEFKAVNEAYARLAEIASPIVILALLNEIERLGARLCMCRDCQGQGEIYSGRSSYEGYHQPPEPIMDVCGTCGGDGVLGPVQDFEAIATERDQLQAENQALRKDSVRYKWLRSRDVDTIRQGGVFAGVTPDNLVINGEDLDRHIDAAMAKVVH